MLQKNRDLNTIGNLYFWDFAHRILIVGSSWPYPNFIWGLWPYTICLWSILSMKLSSIFLYLTMIIATIIIVVWLIQHLILIIWLLMSNKQPNNDRSTDDSLLYRLWMNLLIWMNYLDKILLLIISTHSWRMY